MFTARHTALQAFLMAVFAISALGCSQVFAQSVYDVDLSSSSTIKHFRTFMFGGHALSDVHVSNTVYVMKDIIRDSPSGMRSQGTKEIKSNLGLNALRFYESVWINFRDDGTGSNSEGPQVRYQLGYMSWPDSHTAQQGFSTWYPTYQEILDYCAANNITCVMVLDTIYWDPNGSPRPGKTSQGYGHVYKTQEVGNNVDGVLWNGTTSPAANRNAVPIAQYYHNQGYRNGLILEIGNENIGYGAEDPNPTNVQYANIVCQFSRAIKQVAPEVKVAMSEVSEPDPLDPETAIYTCSLMDTHNTYHSNPNDFSDPTRIDYLIVHPYNGGPYNYQDKAGVTNILDAYVSILNNNSMEHVNLLFTEYSVGTENADYCTSWKWRTWTYGLKQNQGEIAMAIHPRVEGLFEHPLFSGAKAVYAVGDNSARTWSLMPSYGDWCATSHPADTNPSVGGRFMELPSGFIGRRFSEALNGELKKYISVENGSDKCYGFYVKQKQYNMVYLINPTNSNYYINLTGLPRFYGICYKRERYVPSGLELYDSTESQTYVPAGEHCGYTGTAATPCNAAVDLNYDGTVPWTETNTCTTLGNSSSNLSIYMRAKSTQLISWGKPRKNDIDMDGKADLISLDDSVTPARWRICSSNGQTPVDVTWRGSLGDWFLTGSYDTDGMADLVVCHDSGPLYWYVLTSGSNFTGERWTSPQNWGGDPTDIPFTGDYDGDGISDLALYRGSNNNWYLRTSSSDWTNSWTYALGSSGDTPLSGDYDGDGTDDIAVYHPATASQFLIRTSSSNFATTVTYNLGSSSTGDTPVVGDFDGDCKCDPAIYHLGLGDQIEWRYLLSSSGYTDDDSYPYRGWSGQGKTLADYDGDGCVDVGYVRFDYNPMKWSWWRSRTFWWEAQEPLYWGPTSGTNKFVDNLKQN